jgi:hypothetical protein
MADHPTRSPDSPDPTDVERLRDILDRMTTVAQADWQPMTRGYEEFYGLLADARAALMDTPRSPDSVRTPDLDVDWAVFDDLIGSCEEYEATRPVVLAARREYDRIRAALHPPSPPQEGTE